MLHHHLTGPPDAPPLVLGPSLGTSAAVWAPLLPALSRRFRVLGFDLPGHGRSPAELLPSPEPGRTTVGDLASLVLALADHHGWERFHYAGISLGGAVGAHLAAHRPQRIASLALVCSSARFGPPEPWHERAALVRAEGTTPLLETSPGRWFASAAGADTPFARRLLADLAGADPAGYAACCDAVAGYDLRSALHRITAPTLVVGGSLDTATPPAHARELAAGIPVGRLRLLDCGHLAAESPRELEAALLSHLQQAATESGTRVPPAG
ncbi:alpha/beta fold hydrolase [Streptomyces qinzhouensis]|uniref:Alpha/beta fold hydrolase n=1 Tax=Streptomyces qinzhouensis TaxID=2599401 RepID=A0A5B8J1K0_9ACTN|nr:alpha/beta fold hydrolase [Streptomyces qinzhouensis]QDY75615.1 alpha/beta fold hydrolase [Streptomyces qinzhouensis]